MKLFEMVDRAARNLGVVEKGIGPLIGDQVLFRSMRSILASQGTKVTSPYSQSIWVYAALNAITSNLSRVPFLLKKDAGDLEPGKIEEGPLYEVMMKPNPLMILKTLIQATFTYMGLRGEAIWILERENISQIPQAIWCFDPIRFSPSINKETGFIDFWTYRGNTKFTFYPHQILHFKDFNPYDDIRGISPIESARLSIDSDYGASVYNKVFYDNGAKIGGFISVPGELTDEQFSRLVEQFEERHQGAPKAHKIAVVEGDGKFTEAKISQKDMDFIDGKNMTRREILAAYKVNEVVMGIYTNIKSYEGIRAAHKAFWEECLMPKITYFEEFLWTNFFSKMGVRRGKGRIWAEFDLANVGPLQANFSDKITTAQKMATMGWPVNHINKRLQLGMKEVPWGDEWFVPGGYVPITALLNAPAPAPTTPPSKSDTPPVDEGKDFKSKAEIELKAKFKKFLFESRKKTLGMVIRGEDWTDFPYKGDDHSKFKEELISIYTESVNTGVFHSQQQIGELFTLNQFSKDVSFHVESRVLLIIDGFNSLIRTTLMMIDKESKNESVADKVRDVYNTITVKSSLIAKREAQMAFEFGKKLVLEYVKKEISPSLSIELLGLSEKSNVIQGGLI